MTGASPRPTALIYVQHLLGIGHLARIGRVAEGLIEAGVRVTMARGGPADAYPPPAGAEIVQLAPVKADASNLTALLHPDGRIFDAEDRDARCGHLLGLMERLRPDILIIEAFPFGRRVMRFELLPLVEAARRLRTPVVAASIRDILQQSRKLGRAEETAALVERFFDIVLVHGEEQATPLSKSFPLAARIAPRLRYTGLVGPSSEPLAPGTSGRHAVVVSAGGGAVGAQLLRTAIAARAATAFADAPWLIVAGPNLPEPEFQALRGAGGGAIDIRRSVPDLPKRLAGASLSISQAGYNTVAEIMAAGCAAVLVPYAGGGETEQSVRASALARAGRAVALPEAELSPERLAAAMAAAAALPRAAPQRLGGAGRSAKILLELLAERRNSVSYQGGRAWA